MRRLWKLAWLWAGMLLIFSGCKNKHSEIEENLNLGQRYLENQEYEQAVVGFSKCIEIDPKCEEAFLGRGEAYAGMEQWEEAVSDCRTAMELDEGDTRGYLLLGRIVRDRILHLAPMTEEEYWDLMDLLWKKQDDEAVAGLILEIEELVSNIPSSYFIPEAEEEDENGSGAQEAGGEENILWNGKIQIVEPAKVMEETEAFVKNQDLKLLYALKKETETDHFEIKEIHIDGEKYYVLIYYSEWEESGYKGDKEYHAVLYENGKIRSVLKGTEDTNKVGDTGLNIDGRNVYDLDGNKILEVSEKYWLDWGFFHGLCRVKDEDVHLFGYMNSKGEVVIPCRYENTKGFESGAAFSISNGRRGYINTQGEWILDEQYDFIGDGTERGLYCVRDKESRKCGYVDVSGQFIIPCIYDDASPFNGNPGEKNHTAIVFTGSQKKMIDDQGNDVIGEEYELTGYSYEYGLFAVREKATGLYGFADRRGKIRIPCMYDEVFDFRMAEGMVKVRSGEEEFWVDMNNQRAEPAERTEEELYEWRFMIGGGQYAEASGYYVAQYKAYNWDGEMLLEGKEDSSIVVIDGTDFYYDDGNYIYVYRYEEEDAG